MSHNILCLIAALCFIRNSESASTNGLNKPEEGILDNNVNTTKDTERIEKPLHKECAGLSLNPKCLKIHALSFIEDLSSRDEFTLFPGLSVIKENNSNTQTPEEIAAELSRKFPGKPEEKLNRFLLYRLQNYLEGHSLKYKLLDLQATTEAIDMATDSAETGRQHNHHGGGNGGTGGLVTAALAVKGALGAAALGALALLAGKALMASLLALVLALLASLKGHGGHKSTTYEIITKPEVSHHHSHSQEEHHEHDHGHYGGYRRAYDPSYMHANSYYEPYGTTR